MNIEISEPKTLNTKEQLYIDQVCHNLMKETGGNFNAYLNLKSSINTQYQVFITPKDNNKLEDKMGYLIMCLTHGLKKPVRGVVINDKTIGIQIFDELRNPKLLKEAIGHTLNQFDVEQLGEYE
jgi:hypothetical protein